MSLTGQSLWSKREEKDSGEEKIGTLVGQLGSEQSYLQLSWL